MTPVVQSAPQASGVTTQQAETEDQLSQLQSQVKAAVLDKEDLADLLLPQAKLRSDGSAKGSPARPGRKNQRK